MKIKSRLHSLLAFSLFLSILLFIESCNNVDSIIIDNNNDNKYSTYSQIKERGVLRIITNYNSTDYFIYRGKPMGFQLELMQMLAEHLGLKLEIIVENNIEECHNILAADSADIIAIGLTVTNERSDSIKFTEHFGLTKQVLVQRKPDNWKKLSKKKIEKSLIRNQIDLGKKIIYAQKGSVFVSRLKTLSSEIGDTIYVAEIDAEAEEVIKMVVDKKIKYTVCDEYVALVNKKYYPELDVQTNISFPQKLAWVVNQESDTLTRLINNWIVDFKTTTKFKILYNKYFNNPKSAKIFDSDFYFQETGKISPFDDSFKKYSKKINWDWKLIASLVYQESRFVVDAKSWAGAYGLMQLMPATAGRFNVDTSSAPVENIRAGIDFIKWLDRQLIKTITDSLERKYFILASYNVGLGHVLDAMRLAKKYDKDPNIWFDNVELYLALKAKPKYYLDPVVRYGYCRGYSATAYVKEITERYKHYNNLTPEN